jgi:hypothetical protein
MVDKWTHIFTRIFFAAACIFSILYILERIFFFYGVKLLWIPVSYNRLLDFVVITLIFTITLLLRQIREELIKQSTKS